MLRMQALNLIILFKIYFLIIIMNNEILSKVFSLINKTGDRCIIVSEKEDKAFAIMSISEYERMTVLKSDVSSLSEDELLDKINRDIAVWKSQQNEAQESSREIQDKSFYDFDKKNQSQDDFWIDEPDAEEDPYYFESV